MDNSAKTGHLYLWATLTVSLVMPLALILLSYMDIISGTADFIIAFAVIGSMLYIIGGGIWTVIQDKKDLETA